VCGKKGHKKMTKNVNHIFTGGIHMSCSIVHQNIKMILEEGGTAYSTIVETGGVSNMDYAGYCCHVSLNKLRQSLNQPNIRLKIPIKIGPMLWPDI
jgi:hypothetical protein